MQRLAFVMSTILSNANIIGRGVDWVLTKTAIIQAIDDEPYVNTVNLFSDNGTAFLYSILRSKELPSGIDPITGQAWGLSESNGNSEGYGYFNSTDFIQSVNKHYSLLPAVGDWNIVGNFLVRRFVDDEQDNPYAEAYNSMLNIRPLIPLEFNGSTPAYGCGFSNDIFITHCNGELWARGLYHFGRVYILPAVFDEDGTPQEFYLYISPDYPKSPYKSNENTITKADWLNLGVLCTGENLYGFLTAQASSLDNGLCFASDSPKLYVPSDNEWQEFSQSGQMFIDILNNSGLVLYDDGAKFLNGTSYECKGLPQWLAPAGSVDAVTADYVMASCDNTILATYIQQGFYRESLAGKNLSITANAYSGKKFSLGIRDNNVKAIQVNSIESKNNIENIAWENIYKQPVSLSKIHSFSKHFENTVAPYPIFVEEGCYGDSLIDFNTLPDYNGDFEKWWHSHYGFWGRVHVRDDWYCPIYPFGLRCGFGTDSWGNFVYSVNGYSFNGQQKLFYIHPISGNPVSFTLTWDDDNLNQPLNNNLQDRLDFFSNNSTYDVPEEVVIQNGQIGYSYTYYSNGNSETRFKPIMSVSSVIFDWQNNSLGDFVLQNVSIPKNIPQNVTCSASAVFTEKISNAKFLCHFPSAFKSTNSSVSGALANINNPQWQYFNYWNINSLNEDNSYSTQGLHVVVLDDSYDDYSEGQFFVFRSELHPDIFDLKSEAQRSKLS